MRNWGRARCRVGRLSAGWPDRSLSWPPCTHPQSQWVSATSDGDVPRTPNTVRREQYLPGQSDSRMSWVNWARELMPSLANALWTWVFTVCRERCSCSATSRLVALILFVVVNVMVGLLCGCFFPISFLPAGGRRFAVPHLTCATRGPPGAH